MSNLLLPEHYQDLLMVSACDERSFDGMIIINQSSTDWLAGKLDTGTYFDVLEQFGIEPFRHINPVEDLAFSQILRLDLLT